MTCLMVIFLFNVSLILFTFFATHDFKSVITLWPLHLVPGKRESHQIQDDGSVVLRPQKNLVKFKRIQTQNSELLMRWRLPLFDLRSFVLAGLSFIDTPTLSTCPQQQTCPVSPDDVTMMLHNQLGYSHVIFDLSRLSFVTHICAVGFGIKTGFVPIFSLYS